MTRPTPCIESILDDMVVERRALLTMCVNSGKVYVDEKSTV